MSGAPSKPLGCARCRAVKLARALGLTSANVDDDHEILARILYRPSKEALDANVTRDWIGTWLDKRRTLPRSLELDIVEAMEATLANRTRLSASELPRDTPHMDDCCADDEDSHDER